MLVFHRVRWRISEIFNNINKVYLIIFCTFVIFLVWWHDSWEYAKWITVKSKVIDKKFQHTCGEHLDGCVVLYDRISFEGWISQAFSFKSVVNWSSTVKSFPGPHLSHLIQPAWFKHKIHIYSLLHFYLFKHFTS